MLEKLKVSFWNFTEGMNTVPPKDIPSLGVLMLVEGLSKALP